MSDWEERVSSWGQDLLPGLHDYQKRGILCDVEFNSADNRVVMAHSCIVGAASPALCEQMLQLSGSTRSANVQLPYLHLRSLIDFIYTGSWRLAECSVEEMQYAAEMFELSLGDFVMEPGGPTFARPAKVKVTNLENSDPADWVEAQNSDEENQSEIGSNGDTSPHAEQQNDVEPAKSDSEVEGGKGEEAGRVPCPTLDCPRRQTQNCTKKMLCNEGKSKTDGTSLSASSIKKEPLEGGEGDFAAISLYQCDMCWQDFNTVMELYEHKKSHKETKRYRCRYCDKRFHRSHHRMRHQAIHTGDKTCLYECKFCSKRFSSVAERSGHQEEHRRDRPYKCSFCAKGFKNTSALRAHEMSLHTARTFKCDLCPQTCPTKSQLDKHQLKHTITEKKHVCQTCGAKFKYSHNLKEHMRKHSNDKPYKCQFCEKRFLSRSAWTEHERTHTGEQPHICEHCGLAFNRVQAYRQHLRIHTGERPYKCKHCEKSFRKLENKRMHENTHTGLKPYQCRICEKSFANSNTRKVHERIHSKMKPFMCHICNGCFTRKDNLLTHQQKIHHLRNSDVSPAKQKHADSEMMDVTEVEENITEVQTEDVLGNQSIEGNGYSFVVKSETVPSPCFLIERTDVETQKLVIEAEGNGVAQMVGDIVHLQCDSLQTGDVQEIIDSVNIVGHVEEVVVAEQE